MKKYHINDKIFQQLQYVHSLAIRVYNIARRTTFEQAQNKPVLKDFLGKSLEEIGETIIHIEHVEPDFLYTFHLQWHGFKRLRNIIAHQYYNFKFERIWDDILNFPDFIHEIEYVCKKSGRVLEKTLITKKAQNFLKK